MLKFVLEGLGSVPGCIGQYGSFTIAIELYGLGDPGNVRFDYQRRRIVIVSVTRHWLMVEHQ